MSSTYLVMGLKTRWILVGKEIRFWEPVEVDPKALLDKLARMGVDTKNTSNIGRLTV